MLLYFGYTNCRDFCPTTMGDWKQIRQQLGDDADSVQFVMVSVDPERDTEQTLGQFLARFDSTFIGLRPSAEQLEALSKEYGVGVDSHAAGHDKTGLHGTHSYLLDPQGQLRVVYPYGVDVEAVTSDIRQLLRSS
jgi:protein SCO1/2